ncbi:MAG: hypothetical protein M3Q78_08475 [Acidobacteriota bacterium]|jgi:hypothetical protein|nr:hypothetical protein [Acidobacteriota bacterium]
MRLNITFFTTILISTFFLSGCTSSTDTTNSTNTPNKNTNVATVNTNNPLETTKKPEAATTNNAPTLTPVVEGYYAALLKKDEAGAKKFLSNSAIKYWEEEMKSEDLPTLLAILEDNEAPVEVKREVRNEKITGETAVAEIRGGSLGVWTPIAFVKENGEWKFASSKESLALQETVK